MLTVLLADITVKHVPVANFEIECNMVCGEFCVDVIEYPAEDVLLGNELNPDVGHNTLICSTCPHAFITE